VRRPNVSARRRLRCSGHTFPIPNPDS
jgi:hypothetical protein